MPLILSCFHAETCERDKVVESLCRIGSQMKDTNLVEFFFSFWLRLILIVYKWSDTGFVFAMDSIFTPAGPVPLNFLILPIKNRTLFSGFAASSSTT